MAAASLARTPSSMPVDSGIPQLNPALVVGASARWGIDRGPSRQSFDPRGEAIAVLEAKAKLSNQDVWAMMGGHDMDGRSMSVLDNDHRVLAAIRSFQGVSGASRQSSHKPKRVQLFA